VANSKKKGFTIDPKDVALNRSWLRASGRGGNIARTSRAVGTQEGRMELIHTPTGISVSGIVNEGVYTRVQMTAAMDALKVQLWAELESKIARHLRLPGR
jgi:protein subunit release factor A